MPNTKRAILWDLDGTIVNTYAGHLQTWESALEAFGFQLDRALFVEQFGRNNASLLPALLGFEPEPDLMTKIIETKERLFLQISAEWITLVPGVISWLKAAAEMNYLQAIASSAPMDNIRAMLAVHNLEGYFATVVSGSNLPAKPEPDVFLRAAEVLQVTKENCLVMEDSVAGVAGARRAGMRCIAVTTTWPRSKLSQADFVVEDFTMPFIETLRTLSWA